MQLRLNPSHPLCSPSRNIVFATFGTGYGGRVDDLVEPRLTGVMQRQTASEQIVRSLVSNRPPGFPPDFHALASRGTETGTPGVVFSGSTKVTSLVDTFTVAAWVRPWSVNVLQIPISTFDLTNGWLLYSSNDAATPGTMVVYTVNGGQVSNWVFPYTQAVGEWVLLCFSFLFSDAQRMRGYANGRELSLSSSEYTDGVGASSTGLQVGGAAGYSSTFKQQWDIGPCIVWGSVLSAADVALLYRDTFGMVTRPSPLALRMGSAPAAQVRSRRPGFSLGMRCGL